MSFSDFRVPHNSFVDKKDLAHHTGTYATNTNQQQTGCTVLTYHIHDRVLILFEFYSFLTRYP